MIRRLFALLSALSLVLCLGTCVLWVRSYQVSEAISFQDVRFSNLHGIIYVRFPDRFSDVPYPQRKLKYFHFREYEFDHFNLMITAPEYRHFRVFYFMPFRWWGFTQLGAVGSSHFVPVGVFALLPGSWLHRRRRGLRPSRGVCPACGYDLRATLERCPECGEVPAGAKA
jgi:hypothetical protein